MAVSVPGEDEVSQNSKGSGPVLTLRHTDYY